MNEPTPIYLQPAFVIFAVSTLITGVSAIVGFTVWLIRQEGKLAHQAEKTAALEAETALIWKAIEEHKDREGMHFNQAVARQVEEKNDARFSRVEGDIREIKEILRDLAKR